MKRQPAPVPSSPTLFTIGFTKKSAEEFFSTLREAGVRTVIDTRLNNRSQLAGFAKQQDLEYFLREISGINYDHDLQLAPTPEILTPYRNGTMPWEEYQREFNALLADRAPANDSTQQRFDRACLLCSEHTAEFCHRRLVAEYLQQHWPSMTIRHL